MRKVKVFKYERNPDTNLLELVEQGIGNFHAFGCDFEDLDHGVGNYSTAIVEMENGKIENVAVENIQFID